MTTYDPKIIQTFADRLYSKANSIVFRYLIYGAIIGGFSGAFSLSMSREVFVIIGAVVGGAIGFSIGQERVFQYKLQAQTALCQVKIEENSRK